MTNLDDLTCIWREPIRKEIEMYGKKEKIGRLIVNKCLVCNGLNICCENYVAKKDVRKYENN